MSNVTVLRDTGLIPPSGFTTHTLEHPDSERVALVGRRPPGQSTGAGIEFTLTLIGIGLVGGVLSGLFAVGGGILMVPLLVWRTGMDQRRAAATSLVAILPAALVGSLAYLRHGQVDAIAASFVTTGAVAGAVIGSRLLRRIPVAQLRWMFVVFILLVAGRLLLVTPHRGGHVDLTLLVVAGYVGIGLVMGLASGLFGIGGGIIAVPLMVSLFAVSDLVAKGTSLLVSVPTSAVGTWSNRRAGLVDVRAGLVVGVAAAAASVPAVSLSVRLSPQLSAQLFAVLLVAVAAQITVKSLRNREIR